MYLWQMPHEKPLVMRSNRATSPGDVQEFLMKTGDEPVYKTGGRIVAAHLKKGMDLQERRCSMRRKEKEIFDRREMDEIIRRSSVLRLAMVDGGRPYLVPVCFGYHENALYIHCAPEGRKIDILRQSPLVCFEFDLDASIVRADKACNWTVRYSSVIGYGVAVFIHDARLKRDALKIIMNQYADAEIHIPEKAVDTVAIIRIDIMEMTGKRSG